MSMDITYTIGLCMFSSGLINNGLQAVPGGISSNFRYLGSARKKTWTQSDIRFCENEGSNRFKINEKGGHLDRKYRRKFIQNT